jgi:hypothetical protein
MRVKNAGLINKPGQTAGNPELPFMDYAQKSQNHNHLHQLINNSH